MHLFAHPPSFSHCHTHTLASMHKQMHVRTHWFDNACINEVLVRCVLKVDRSLCRNHEQTRGREVKEEAFEVEVSEE